MSRFVEPIVANRSLMVPRGEVSLAPKHEARQALTSSEIFEYAKLQPGGVLFSACGRTGLCVGLGAEGEPTKITGW